MNGGNRLRRKSKYYAEFERVASELQREICPDFTLEGLLYVRSKVEEVCFPRDTDIKVKSLETEEEKSLLMNTRTTSSSTSNEGVQSGGVDLHFELMESSGIDISYMRCYICGNKDQMEFVNDEKLGGVTCLKCHTILHDLGVSSVYSSLYIGVHRWKKGENFGYLRGMMTGILRG